MPGEKGIYWKVNYNLSEPKPLSSCCEKHVQENRTSTVKQSILKCHWKPVSTITDQDSCAIMNKMSVWCSQKKKKKVAKRWKQKLYLWITYKERIVTWKKKKKRFHIHLHKSYIIWSELLNNKVIVMMIRWSPVESSTYMSPIWLLKDFGIEIY